MHSDMSVVMLGQKRVPSLNGGIERVLTELSPELVKQGVAVTCLNRAGEPIVDGDYPKTKGPFKGVKLRSVWTIRGKGLSAVSASVSGAVRALFGGFDVVHFHAEGPSAMIWLPKLFKKRCVVTVHGLDWKRDKWRGGFGARYIKFGERMIAKYADAIIVLNVDTRRYFEQTYHRESYYIPNGVSPVTAQGAALIGERYGLAPRDYVLSVSRLTPEKGLHDLIAAFRQLDTTKRR
ncbi:glycosyltransferase family 4 protein [Lacticaseibacillus parakribbianus]|uniref:glycosyltransferase family 4 protein n=1 Tax=Lacticaseibacillus parakribbianus TaxID=2970927 RepID=UPI0021CB543B|nr:glycosyltransferase family 4 protein [Lacticaseibacillus parakribbianus]